MAAAKVPKRAGWEAAGEAMPAPPKRKAHLVVQQLRQGLRERVEPRRDGGKLSARIEFTPALEALLEE